MYAPLNNILSPFSGTDDDLEYYVRECGDILGVTTNLPQDNRDAKHIIEYVFTQVVEFKKLNQVSKAQEIQSQPKSCLQNQMGNN